MNRFTRTLALAALGVSAMTLTPTASARDMALGLWGGYASHNDGAYVLASFQIDMARHVRLSPEVGYAFRNDGKSALLINADVQFPFRVARGLNLYPLAGLTFNSWSYSHADTSNKVGADLGGGLEVLLTDNLKLSLQAKYSLMPDTSGAFVGAGIHFVF